MHTIISTLNYAIAIITKHSIQCCSSHNAIIAIDIYAIHNMAKCLYAAIIIIQSLLL